MIGLDFAGLPPEVNSARMYAGPGAGSLVEAAAVWGTVAAELSSTASSYRAVVSTLTSGPWVGPSSGMMAAAVAPYLSWMNITAAQAGQTASQLGSAVAAYEAAFAATVPPVEIEVNRALLASLVQTNAFGQNTAAIASTEAQYGEMWAQDTAAMYGYAGASAAATKLTSFNSPPQTTNQAGTNAQGAAASNATSSGTQSALANVPNTLQSLSSGASTAGSNPIIDWLNSPNALSNLLASGPFQAYHSYLSGTLGSQFFVYGTTFAASGAFLTMWPMTSVAWNPLIEVASAAPAAAAASAVSDVSGTGMGSTLASSSGPGPMAGLGQAATVGKLSVPQSWASAPGIRLAATALPAGGLEALPQAGPGGFYGGAPMMGPVASVVNAPRGDQPRARSRHKVVAALPGDSGMDDDARSVKQNLTADDDDAASERDELELLRKAIVDVGKQRDWLNHTAATMVRSARSRQ